MVHYSKHINLGQNMMKPISIIIFTVFALVAGQSFAARQCIVQSSSVPASGSLEVYISQDDHPHFSDPSKICDSTGYALPYYIEGYKAMGLSAPTQAECLANPKSVISLSQGFAPWGVFFRSKASKAVANYLWEIKDSNNAVIAKFDGFNAAYIFENPGTYSANLSVVFKDSTTATASKNVTVWPRAGKIYYVDSTLGDDRFNGISQTPDLGCDPASNPTDTCSGPWKTATRGFSLIAPRSWVSGPDGKYSSTSICAQTSTKNVTANGKTSTVTSCDTLRSSVNTVAKPGDQILFKRGQTFEFETGMITTDGNQQAQCSSMISTGHWPASIGLLFGAYGTGNKPKIINTAVASCDAFDYIGVGMFHMSMQDLAFDMQSAKPNPFNPGYTNRALFLYTPGQPMNLIFNRVDIKRMDQGLLLYETHGAFVNDSTLYDSNVTQVFSGGSSDIALINNKFDYAGNHLAYANMANGLVMGNTFSRQAFGRTQLRVYGSDPAHFTTENVWISDNNFIGWKDPRTTADCAPGTPCQYADGKRYNFSLVEFSPNTGELKFNDNFVFKRNLLKNAENMLRIGASAHLLVEDNIFVNNDSNQTARILLNSDPNLTLRPLNDIVIRNNTFVERNPNRVDRSVMQIYNYEQLACDDLPTGHQDINIMNNNLYSVAASNCLVSKSTQAGSDLTCLLDSSQTGSGGTLGTMTGLTLSDNQFTPSTPLTTINQAVADKTTQITATKNALNSNTGTTSVTTHKPSIQNTKIRSIIKKRKQ